MKLRICLKTNSKFDLLPIMLLAESRSGRVNHKHHNIYDVLVDSENDIEFLFVELSQNPLVTSIAIF